MNTLPFDIWTTMANYLRPSDLQQLSQVDRELYNTCKRLSPFLIKKSVIVDVDKWLKGRVAFLKWGWQFDVSCANRKQITDASLFDGARVVKISYFPNLIDVSGLCGVQKLSLVYCLNVTDVKALANIPDLVLLGIGMTDVSCLGRVRNLTLTDCPNVTDVSGLATVGKKLVIQSCSGVTDVSALGKVPTLLVMRCPIVTGIYALGLGGQYSRVIM